MQRENYHPVIFRKISKFTVNQMYKEAKHLQSIPVLSLAAALVPPFENFSGDVLSVQLDSSAMQSHSGEDHRPCEVDHRGCDNSFFQNLNWSRHAVEPRTGIEFPTILDNLIAGERNSSFTSEVLVGTGSRIMKIIRIKSLKVYAFGFYVHPFDVCQKLGWKYASVPFCELNKQQDFYQDLLREDISMTVRLVVSCNGIKINTVRDVFEKSLRARLFKANPDTDYHCLETFGSMFSQDIPIHAGTTINFRRTTDGHLITEIGGNHIGAVQSRELCRAIFDMYIGDVPQKDQTLQQLSRLGTMWRNSVGFSSKLLTSKSSCSRLPLLNHGVASRSTSTAAGSGPESTEAAGTVKVGFSSTEWVRTGSPTSSAVDLSSFAAASVLKGRDIVDMAKHYGRCYAELSKARLSMLVVATSGTGYILGSGSAIDYMGLCCTCAGTMMVAASASTLNQVFEVKNDAKMNRTKKRPLPSGRISIPHAVTWAASTGILGTGLLASKANMLAAGLGASNLVLYAFVYTPLKQIHPINTWVGAIVGAIPPLLGWAAASGQVSLNGMLLPAALYFWQIPHFMALAYLCRKDYADGGFRMYSLADASGQRTASVALRNCLYLLPLGYLAYDWSLTSGWFCLESTLLALAISGTAISFYLNRTTKDARRMFHASLLYLPVFMSGLLVHRVTESEQQMTIEHMSKIIELSPSLETAEAAQEEKESSP